MNKRCVVAVKMIFYKICVVFDFMRVFYLCNSYFLAYFSILELIFGVVCLKKVLFFEKFFVGNGYVLKFVEVL